MNGRWPPPTARTKVNFPLAVVVCLSSALNTRRRLSLKFLFFVAVKPPWRGFLFSFFFSVLVLLFGDLDTIADGRSRVAPVGGIG